MALPGSAIDKMTWKPPSVAGSPRGTRHMLRCSWLPCARTQGGSAHLALGTKEGKPRKGAGFHKPLCHCFLKVMLHVPMLA